MRLLLPVTAALLIPAIFTSGCSSLDTSARAEGTGIQIIGAIIVLAKYKASQNQIAIAETKAREAFVELAMKPAYEARTKKLKKVIASSPARPRRPAPTTAGPTRRPVAEDAPDPAAKARAELAALSNSWREAASQVTNGRYAADFAEPAASTSNTAAASFPKMSESQVLAASVAYVPRYLAVSVPAEKAVAGSKAAVMLWDTKAEKIASDTVYALDRTPPTGKPSEIDHQKVQFAAQ